MLSEEDIRFLIFNIASDDEFNAACLAVFRYQYKYCRIYHQYVKSLKISEKSILHYNEIPFLPIEFFKTQHIISKPNDIHTVKFTSSGTTGQVKSTHYVSNIELYKKSFTKAFHTFYGEPDNYCILGLLPGYLERSGSSLIYMCKDLMEQSKHPFSGFYLNNIKELLSTLKLLKQASQKTLLIGVTYALLDLAEHDISLNDNFIVMETGGMKGKRREMIKEEIHSKLKHKFNVSTIHSEYGMTELLSQAYSLKNGVFTCPPWMRVMVRDTSDPFKILNKEKVGGINVIDLANFYSCSFIETKDLGKVYDDNSFEVTGRFDNSDLRGCNLMIS